MVDFDKLKKLRKETGISLADCKTALEKADGDLEKAKLILKELGKDVIKEKSQKVTKEGIIESYIHPNKKVGVLLELKCQSDFVARSEDFHKLAHEICLQIAAMNPLFVKKEDISDEFLDGERKLYIEEFKDSGKSEKLIEEIVNNKLEKYKEEVSLLSQKWIKDEDKTINDLINEHIRVFGENIEVKRFVRYEI